MGHILTAFAFAVVLLGSAASLQASQWTECAGRATVTSTAQDGEGGWLLTARANEPEAADGQGFVGGACRGEGESITIESEKEVPPGEDVRYKYYFYSGMGADGPVLHHRWTLLD